MRTEVERTAAAGFSLLEVIVAMALMMVIFGVALASTTRLLQFAELADRDMLVATENQRAMNELRNDINCSSRNCIGQYGPEVVGGELRFRVCTGFDDDSGTSTYSDYQVCYYHDAQRSTLVRRFYNADADPSEIDENGYLLNGVPEFPLSGRSFVVSRHCTSVSFQLNVDAGMVTITITNSIGDPGSDTYTEYIKEFSVFPFNHD